VLILGSTVDAGLEGVVPSGLGVCNNLSVNWLFY
jgi:hypothetical protein